MNKKFYGVSTGEYGCGVGDIINGHSWSYNELSNSYFIHTYVNPDKPHLGNVNMEVYYVFTIENNEIKTLTKGE